jgi:hypothetical protein
VSVAPSESAAAPRPKPKLWQRALPWAVTLACFAYLYVRISRAPTKPPELGVFAYLGEAFARIDWVGWLLLMIPYSVLFLLVDTAVLWRAVTWFNARVSFRSLLPVRASAYIISILNEQVGKGAIALFLMRREGVPGWQVGSSMLFIMFCEFFYLLSWATVGIAAEWDRLPAALHAVPWLAAASLVFLLAWVAFFRAGRPPFGATLRERDLLHSFRRAGLHRYATIVLLRSPAMIAAFWVYAKAAGMFGVPATVEQMLGLLPVIFSSALIPLPGRPGPVLLWTLFFPDHVAEMTLFGIIQHNAFVLFNAAIGLLFLRRVNRELSGSA